MNSVKFLQIVNFLMEENGIMLDLDRNLLESRYKKAKIYLDDWNRLLENKELFDSNYDYFKLDDENKFNLKKIKDRICGNYYRNSSWCVGDEDPRNEDGIPITINVSGLCNFMLDKSIKLNEDVEDTFCSRCYSNCLMSYEKELHCNYNKNSKGYYNFKCAFHDEDNIHSKREDFNSLYNMKKIFENYVAFCEYVLYES